jgi:hypothetical protein
MIVPKKYTYARGEHIYSIEVSEWVGEFGAQDDDDDDNDPNPEQKAREHVLRRRRRLAILTERFKETNGMSKSNNEFGLWKIVAKIIKDPCSHDDNEHDAHDCRNSRTASRDINNRPFCVVDAT